MEKCCLDRRVLPFLTIFNIPLSITHTTEDSCNILCSLEKTFNKQSKIIVSTVLNIVQNPCLSVSSLLM